MLLSGGRPPGRPAASPVRQRRLAWPGGVMGDDRPGAVGFLAGFSAGSRIAGYRLEEQIGEGGMAVVVPARGERVPRRGGLQMLPPRLGGEEEVPARFFPGIP